MNENRQKLQSLLTDVFLLEPDEFRFELTRADVRTWDSLAVVSIAVGVEEVFGYHMKPEQAIAVDSVADIIAVLESNGISFDG
jgi:acyl carrier protein